MRKIFSAITALFLLCAPLMAAPEDGVDVTLPRSTDRYIPGLISGEEAQVDRRMEVTEHEQEAVPEQKPQEKVEKPSTDDGENFFVSLFENQTVRNLLILGVFIAVFILYRLRSGGSRR